MTRRIILCAVSLLVAFLTFLANTTGVFAAGSDSVLVLQDGQKQTVNGTIESITGLYGLTISSGEQTLRIPMTQVLAIRTAKTAEYQKADDLFESARQSRNTTELQEALSLYNQARRNAELPLWLRQWFTVRIVDCHRMLGQDALAAQQFFLLCHIDPYTPFIDHIPLNWAIRSSFEEQAARAPLTELATQWLSPTENPTKHPTPVGQLLAASLLLDSPGPSRQNAKQVLESLVTCTSPDDKSLGLNETCRIVSLLAMTQLWRAKLLTGFEKKELPTWLETIENLPVRLQGGPLFLAAEGFFRSGDKDQARTCFLKLKILHGDQTNLLRKLEERF